MHAAYFSHMPTMPSNSTPANISTVNASIATIDEVWSRTGKAKLPGRQKKPKVQLIVGSADGILTAERYSIRSQRGSRFLDTRPHKFNRG
jgi:hypothetical protein